MKFVHCHQVFRHQIFRLGLPVVAGPATAMMVVLSSGCTTMSLEDTMPRAASNYANENAAPTQSGSGARLTGEYPNLNIPPASAAEPISTNEREQLTRDLETTKNRLNASVPADNAAAEEARLRRLARSHAQRRLAEIESAPQDQ